MSKLSKGFNSNTCKQILNPRLCHDISLGIPLPGGSELHTRHCLPELPHSPFSFITCFVSYPHQEWCYFRTIRWFDRMVPISPCSVSTDCLAFPMLCFLLRFPSVSLICFCMIVFLTRFQVPCLAGIHADVSWAHWCFHWYVPYCFQCFDLQFSVVLYFFNRLLLLYFNKCTLRSSSTCEPPACQ